MAEESAKLRIPYIAASQAQKHVTHNEAMTLLDTLVQLSVLDKDLTAPPAEPAEGDTYIVAGSATGAWEGWDTRVARFIDGTWRSYLPGAGDGAGWLAYVLDEEILYRFDGANWAPAFDTFVPDAVVDAIAGRDDYDDEDANFSVLVTEDAGNGNQPTLYFKLSGSSADWSNGITWLPVGGEVATIEPEGAWDSGTTYAARDAVSYEGSSYVSRVDANTDNQPDESPDEWMLLAEKGEIVNLVPEGEWSGGTTYDTGDAVSYEDASYVSRIDDNTNNQPDTSPTQWMLLAAGGGGAFPLGADSFFHVHKNGTNQTGVAVSTEVKLTWATEVADQGGYFDLANGRWTPPAGLVIFWMKGQFTNANMADLDDCIIRLFKNGSLYATPWRHAASGTSAQAMQAFAMDNADGDDYYEFYVRTSGSGDKTIQGTTDVTFWMGCRIAAA